MMMVDEEWIQSQRKFGHAALAAEYCGVPGGLRHLTTEHSIGSASPITPKAFTTTNPCSLSSLIRILFRGADSSLFPTVERRFRPWGGLRFDENIDDCVAEGVFAMSA